jgi:hypothetical protein
MPGRIPNAVVACGSKVFSILLLPIFCSQSKKWATEKSSYRSAEGKNSF